jgi:hypothetical protein
MRDLVGLGCWSSLKIGSNFPSIDVMLSKLQLCTGLRNFSCSEMSEGTLKSYAALIANPDCALGKVSCV